ncbi:GIY-YIG nuclease family protein [Clostridium gasigenes]|uniref:GIY-YIG nuclease family protein n=1 Tax=Clostridium gasigenes TaxID=94869 RepID=UPI001C0DC36B|nr:hypothetical protein [Clostridium gasigenes]
MRVWLKANRILPLTMLMKKLKMKLAGYFRYYGITDNSRDIENFRYLVRRLTFKWLNRRSQKKSYTWIRFDRMFKNFEVPKAKINEGIATIKISRSIIEDTVKFKAKLPDSAGAYLICAKGVNVLPERMKQLEYKFVNELPVIYVGIAGRPTSRVKSLRNRDFKNHFNGTARTSTLRKSIGILFGFEKEFENPNNNLKYKFTNRHEDQLSKWMKDNLVMNFVAIDNPMEFELYIIKTYEPPLNLKDNKSERNKVFRKELSILRTTAYMNN